MLFIHLASAGWLKRRKVAWPRQMVHPGERRERAQPLPALEHCRREPRLEPMQAVRHCPALHHVPRRREGSCRQQRLSGRLKSRSLPAAAGSSAGAGTAGVRAGGRAARGGWQSSRACAAAGCGQRSSCPRPRSALSSQGKAAGQGDRCLMLPTVPGSGGAAGRLHAADTPRFEAPARAPGRGSLRTGSRSRKIPRRRGPVFGSSRGRASERPRG